MSKLNDVEKSSNQPPAVNSIIQKRYQMFRPYIDPISIRPYKPADKKYYFKFYNGVNVTLIRFTFEDNGWRDQTERT